MPDIFLIGKIQTSFACDEVNDVRFYCPFVQISWRKCQVISLGGYFVTYLIISNLSRMFCTIFKFRSCETFLVHLVSLS